MIFKGKQIKKAWTDLLEHKDEFIAMSENGWTNNVLGLEWFIRYVSHIIHEVNTYSCTEHLSLKLEER